MKSNFRFVVNLFQASIFWIDSIMTLVILLDSTKTRQILIQQAEVLPAQVRLFPDCTFAQQRFQINSISVTHIARPNFRCVLCTMFECFSICFGTFFFESVSSFDFLWCFGGKTINYSNDFFGEFNDSMKDRALETSTKWLLLILRNEGWYGEMAMYWQIGCWHHSFSNFHSFLEAMRITMIPFGCKKILTVCFFCIDRNFLIMPKKFYKNTHEKSSLRDAIFLHLFRAQFQFSIWARDEMSLKYLSEFIHHFSRKRLHKPLQKHLTIHRSEKALLRVNLRISWSNASNI